MTQRSCRVAVMRYFGRRGAAFRAVLDGIFFTAFLTTFGTLLGVGLDRSGDVILTPVWWVLVQVHQLSSSADLFALRRAILN